MDHEDHEVHEGHDELVSTMGFVIVEIFVTFVVENLVTPGNQA